MDSAQIQPANSIKTKLLTLFSVRDRLKGLCESKIAVMSNSELSLMIDAVDEAKVNVMVAWALSGDDCSRSLLDDVLAGRVTLTHCFEAELCRTLGLLSSPPSERPDGDITPLTKH